MQCCGDPFRVGSTVSWTAIRPDPDYLNAVLGEEQAARVTAAEEHHGGDDGRENWNVTGTVQSIHAVSCRFAFEGSAAGYPVAGTVVVTSLTAADGWESDAVEPASDLRFVGYVVDVAEGA